MLDKFLASKVAILSLEPPFMVNALSIVTKEPFPMNVFPSKLMIELALAPFIKFCKSLKPYELSLRLFAPKEFLLELSELISEFA